MDNSGSDYIHTTDNNACRIEYAAGDPRIAALEIIAGQKLSEVRKNHAAAHIIQPNIEDSEGQTVYDLTRGQGDFHLHTHNIVGFLSLQSPETNSVVNLQIGSRFDADETDADKTNTDKQYFLQHMLRRVYLPTFLDYDIPFSREHIFEILLAMVFPYYLKRAYAQGIYKEYCHHRYNDDRVRGRIDIPRHISSNIPFAGKIAYSTREYSPNNRITQLIRHTIEYLRTRGRLFDTGREFTTAQRHIQSVTADYHPQEIARVIRAGEQAVRHALLTEYEPLRAICQSILRHRGAALHATQQTNRVHAILFDCAWLWEEYIATLLPGGQYKHPRNRRGGEQGKGGVAVYKGKGLKWYPDFYREEPAVVLDAKYKRLDNEVSRGDIRQMISYLYILAAKHGVLIYPQAANNDSEPATVKKLGELEGYGGTLYRATINIPASQKCKTYSEFAGQIKHAEDEFSEQISQIAR